MLTLEVTALNILLTYLAGSSASVLENTLVEKEHLASAVYFSTESRPDTVIQFALSSVATESLARVETRFFEVLKATAEKELDMKYIKDCINRERRQVKFYAETSGNCFTDPIIKDFLFGKRDGSTLRTLESLEEYDELATWTESRWRDLIKRWMSDAFHVTILGKPSAALSEKLKSEERDRIAAQIEALGEEGLKEKERKLAEAKAANQREIPRDLIERFKVPDTTSIHFITTTTARSGAAQKMGRLENPIQTIIDNDNIDLPLFIHFEHVQSNFVHLVLTMGTEPVHISLRPLLSIYLENFFNTPLLKDGKRFEFEQVIMDLEKDTVGYGAGSGSSLGNSEVLTIRLQVEESKYETAIRWLRSLLFDGIFDLTVTLFLWTCNLDET